MNEIGDGYVGKVLLYFIFSDESQKEQSETKLFIAKRKNNDWGWEIR